MLLRRLQGTTREVLLLVLVHALFGVSINAATLPQWETDIRAFEASDRTNPPPRNAVLFLGSSSIRLWKTLAKDFDGVPVINRGFGGSHLSDSAAFVDRIVLPYAPKQIFLYAGDNDLAAGKTPERVLADFNDFVREVRLHLPQVRICYISIKPSPSRWSLAEKMRQTNALIEEVVRRDRSLCFVDVFTPMLGPDGQPREELFVADRLHMNAQGYELWRNRIQPLLLK